MHLTYSFIASSNIVRVAEIILERHLETRLGCNSIHIRNRRIIQLILCIPKTQYVKMISKDDLFFIKNEEIRNTLRHYSRFYRSAR